MTTGGSSGASGMLAAKALREYEAGHSTEAIALYEDLLRREPDHLDGNFLLGTLCAEQGDYARALSYLGHAADIAPGSAQIQNNLGNLYRLQGDLDQAEQRYERASVLEPGLYEAHYNRGIVARRQNRLADAARHFRQAVVLVPGSLPAWLNLGEILLALGRSAEATTCYRRIVELDPANRPAAHQLAALTGVTPASAPSEYVLGVFDRHAANFEHHLVDVLGYCGPRALRAAVASAAPRAFANAIDIGCGTGLCGVEFRDAVARMVGIDLSPGMLAVAAGKQVYDELRAGDAVELLANHEERFELVLAADVFIYFGRLERVFAAVRERAAPGAIFAFSVEASHRQDFVLQPSGRYAHSRNYIDRLARAHGFHALSRAEVPLRREGNGWIKAGIYVLRAG